MTEIRLLCFNTKMIPGPGGERRGQRIAEALLAAQPAYDVICLQEVFDEDIREILEDALADAFPHRVPKVDDGDLFQEDSGLYFASRIPFASGDPKGAWGFREFRASGPITTSDYWADKGIFGARLAVGSGSRSHELLVFNTHLQSDPDEVGQYREVRAGQLAEIRRFAARALSRAAARSSRVSAVLVGDFNVQAETLAAGALEPTREYRAMLAALEDPRDLFRELAPNDPGFTWNGAENKLIPKGDHDQLRLDYVFALDRIPDVGNESLRGELIPLVATRAEVQRFATDAKTRLSDHFAIDVSLRFSS